MLLKTVLIFVIVWTFTSKIKNSLYIPVCVEKKTKHSVERRKFKNAPSAVLKMIFRDINEEKKKSIN